MSEETIVASTEAVVGEGVAAAEKVSNLLGLSDVTAELENISKGVALILNNVLVLKANIETQVGAFQALIASVKTHLEAISPAAEIAVAKTKIEGLATEVEGLFKKL